MKIKLLTIMAVLLTFAFVIQGNLNTKQAVFDIAIENLSAMSQGENGTEVGTCYREGDSAGEFKFRYLCDSKTSDNRIYPCPSSETYSTNSKSDKCTK